MSRSVRPLQPTHIPSQSGKSFVAALMYANCVRLDNYIVCSTYIVQWGSALCSPVPMFSSTYVPRTYVPRYLCSPVPMFPGTDVPRFLYFLVDFSINR